MPLRFPEVEDIALARSPLKDVICQVRFPPILKIGQNVPAGFQEAIRHRFPEVHEEQIFQFSLATTPGIQDASAQPSGRSFLFRTVDGDSLVTLTVDAYAISTTRYTVWEEFAQDLNLVHKAAMANYGLPYAKRIGLRYINHLTPEQTGCGAFEDLMGLLRPELTALMRTDAWDSSDEVVSQVLLSDGDEHLILRVAARNDPGQPPVIVLDFDYFEESTSIPLNDLIDRCSRYHDVIYRAFRWSIRPEKLELFGRQREDRNK